MPISFCIWQSALSFQSVRCSHGVWCASHVLLGASSLPPNPLRSIFLNPASRAKPPRKNQSSQNSKKRESVTFYLQNFEAYTLSFNLKLVSANLVLNQPANKMSDLEILKIKLYYLKNHPHTTNRNSDFG